MNVISLIVPCFNEETNIAPFYNEICRVIKLMDNADFELLFVDDGSKDGTFSQIRELHEKDPRVKCISFSRNFGKEAAIFSGIRAVSGGCAVILDADLQHPPEVIAEMYEKWREGFMVVEGVKSDRGKESPMHRLFTKVFYGMISRSVGMNMADSSDYKLLDKRVVSELAALRERNTFFRALSFWVGFKKTTVYYKVQDRQTGESKWSTRSLIRYAINNVICFSNAPLNIITAVGIVFVLIALGVAANAFVSFMHGSAASGFPTLTFLLTLGIGGIMISLGIIGVYIGQIYDEVKGRPQYIIGETL